MSEVRPVCSSPSHQQEPGRNLAWSPVGNSIPGKLEEKKIGVGGLVFLSSATLQCTTCNKLKRTSTILDIYNSYISSCPCAQQPAERRHLCLAGRSDGSWVLMTVRSFCAGTVRTLWLHQRDESLGSYCGRLHTLGLSDCLGRVIAVRSMLTVRTAWIFCVVLWQCL